MRRNRTGRLLALATALVAGACGGGDDGGGTVPEDALTEDPAAEPEYGGTLVYGIEADTGNPWKPMDMVCAASCQLIIRAVYDPMADIGEDGTVHPVLAESIEPNEDFTEWTVTLREGITFHDGTPLDGQAIVENFERTRVSPVTARPVADVESVSAEGLTATFALARPWTAFDYGLTSQVSFVASPTWLEAVDAGEARADEPVGTGPFVFDAYESGNRFSAVRNEDYWRTDAEGRALPYLDEIEFRILGDENTRQAALRSGEIDVLHSSNGEVIADFRADADQFRIVEDEAGETAFVMLNAADERGVTSDPEVRRILALATDLEVLNEARGAGVAPIANSPFHPASIGFLEENGQPAFDPVAAAEALEAWEAENGPLEIELKSTTDEAVLLTSQLIQGQWEQAGITTTLDQIEQGQFALDAAQGNFQAFVFRSYAHADPDQLYHFFSTENSGPVGGLAINFSRIENEEIDENLGIIRESADPAARQEAAQTINRTMADEVYNVWLSWVTWTVVAKPEVHNAGVPLVTPDGTPDQGLDVGSHQVSHLWIEQ